MRPIYDSPINILSANIANQIAMELDGQVLKAVQKVFVDVDKQKLEQALTQDKARYEEAYRKGQQDSRMTGKWLYIEDNPQQKYCSICHWSFLRTDSMWDFCPNCGC